MVVNHIYTGNLEDVLKREEVRGVLQGPILIKSVNREELTPENLKPVQIGFHYLADKPRYFTSEMMSVGTFHLVQPPYELASFRVGDGKKFTLYGVIATPLEIDENEYQKIFGTTLDGMKHIFDQYNSKVKK